MESPHPSPPSVLPRAALVIALLVAGLVIASPFGGSADAEVVLPTSEPAIWSGPTGREALAVGWGYRPDPRDAGLREHWERSRADFGRVRVPHVANPLPVTGRRGVAGFRGGVGWYRRPLRVARDGRYAIRFESAHHHATVWLDGRRLGEHVGAYRPFEYRVALRAGRTHVLVVRVDWRSPLAMNRAGWHRGWFNFGGLHREVTVRPVGDSGLSAPRVETHLLDGGRRALVDLGVVLHNHGAARTLAVRGTLRRGAREQRFDFPAAEVASGRSAGFQTQVEVRDPALWSPESPSLYELELEVPGETAYRLRVGLRELDWSGGRLALNGEPLTLRGASLQEDAWGRGDALTPADQDELIEELGYLGANATRAQHPLDPGLLERLDAAGVLVWQHVGPWDAPGNWTSRSPALRREARARVRQSVAASRAHPSILTWNLANEVAGNGHPTGQVPHIEAMARELHRDDPSRPVAVDVWGKHMPRRPGRLYREVDMVGVTSYIGWYEWPFAGPREIERRSRARVRELRRLFPDKVLVVSEFGAEGNRRNPSKEHGGLARQARLLDAHLGAYADLPELSGTLVWALRDFALAPSFGGGSISGIVPGIRLLRGVNEKGLFDVRGRPKPAARIVRRAFGG